MHSSIKLAAAALLANTAIAVPLGAGQHPINYLVDLGERPYYIINNMTSGALKETLTACENNKKEITQWSIGHRGGGTLQFPEETVESTMAGARMGYALILFPENLPLANEYTEQVFWNVM